MGDRQAPYVAVRTDVRKEERVLVIADVAGYNRHEALGRLVDLWCWCADRKLEDAPADSDGYAVSEAVVRRFMGSRGVEAMLGDGCDELAMGARRADGLIYLRGTSATVRALRGHLKTAVAGGIARADEADAAGARHAGRFVRQTTIDQPCNQPDTSRPPADDQPATSSEPARTSVDPRSKILDPDPESEIPAKQSRSRARALASDWTPDRSEANEAAEHVARSRGVDLQLELLKLHDWARATNARRADWEATWRNWTRNARPESRRPGNQPTALQLQLDRVAMLEREEAREKAAAP